MVLSSNLIPESDLPGVPARNPRGEQSLHVAQEHHSVHAVVLTAGLLVKQRQPVIIFVTYKTKKGCDNFHWAHSFQDFNNSSPQALQTTKCIFKDEPKLCWKVLKLKCISGTKHVHDCSLPPAVRLWSPPLGAAGVQLMSLIRDRFMVVRQQRPSRPNINEVAETWLEPAVAIFSLI